MRSVLALTNAVTCLKIHDCSAIRPSQNSNRNSKPRTEAETRTISPLTG